MVADWNQPSPPHGKPGDLNCPHCSGDGVIPIEDSHPPAAKVCVCMHRKEIIKNVERGWKGLIQGRKLQRGAVSALQEYLNDDVWITASLDWFMAHLRWCAIRRPPNWSFKVISDVDLMRAWFGGLAVSGAEIFDADAMSVTAQHLSLVDLIEPPGLLIVRVGVKAARNEAMPEVLLETLYHRMHLRKPIWVWHEPHNPFDESMRSYSEEARETMRHWVRIEQDDFDDDVVMPDAKRSVRRSRPPSQSGGPRTLSVGSGSSKTANMPQKTSDNGKGRK